MVQRMLEITFFPRFCQNMPLVSAIFPLRCFVECVRMGFFFASGPPCPECKKLNLYFFAFFYMFFHFAFLKVLCFTPADVSSLVHFLHGVWVFLALARVIQKFLTPRFPALIGVSLCTKRAMFRKRSTLPNKALLRLICTQG